MIPFAEALLRGGVRPGDSVTVQPKEGGEELEFHSTRPDPTATAGA